MRRFVSLISGSMRRFFIHLRWKKMTPRPMKKTKYHIKGFFFHGRCHLFHRIWSGFEKFVQGWSFVKIAQMHCFLNLSAVVHIWTFFNLMI